MQNLSSDQEAINPPIRGVAAPLSILCSARGQIVSTGSSFCSFEPSVQETSNHCCPQSPGTPLFDGGEAHTSRQPNRSGISHEGSIVQRFEGDKIEAFLLPNY